MDVSAQNFDEHLTTDMADAPGNISYPIATYTYLIIYLTAMPDCDQAVELYRSVQVNAVVHLLTKPHCLSECHAQL